jgi:hypothetical protein
MFATKQLISTQAELIVGEVQQGRSTPDFISERFRADVFYVALA